MATYAGKRSASLGFWATYPAEAVDGLIVSDRLFTFLVFGSGSPTGRGESIVAGSMGAREARPASNVTLITPKLKGCCHG